MDERAGFDVARRVDVQISSAARDAAAHVFAVVPEVDGKDGFGLAERAHLVVHPASLLRGRHQLGHRIHAYGHVGEEPAELGAPFDHLVEIGFASDHVAVLAGVAAGDAEGQLAVSEALHGGYDLAVGAFASAEVGAFLKTFHGNGGNKVLDPQHLVGEFVVDKRGVGEGQEHGIVVLLAQLDDVVLAHERFAAGIDVHHDAQLFALADDVVQLVVGQVELIAVLRCPAAGAVQVAGRGRIHQDGPGDIAAVLFSGRDGSRVRLNVGVVDKVDEDLFQYVSVDGLEHVQHVLVPYIVRILGNRFDRGLLIVEAVFFIEFKNQVHHFLDRCFRVFVDLVEDQVERFFRSKFFDIHIDFSFFADDRDVNSVILTCVLFHSCDIMTMVKNIL